MRFKLTDPDGATSIYLLALTPDAEEQVNRLGPNKIVAAAYDWPTHADNDAYQGWTDRVNVLWWPRGADQFASLLLLLDDARAVVLQTIIASLMGVSKTPDQHVLTGVSFSGDSHLVSGGGSASLSSVLLSGGAGLTLGDPEIDGDIVLFGVDGGTTDTDYTVTVTATTSAGDELVGTGTIKVRSTLADASTDRPYVIVQALLEPGESYAPAGVAAVSVETPLIEWKLYPLAPVRLTEPDASDPFPGLWLLPLVDERYFWRLSPLGGGDPASGSGSGTLFRIDRTQKPDWMPELLAYPDDAADPVNYVEITGNGTSAGITPAASRGVAADQQAEMENWRVVCRDVRSAYNHAAGPGLTPHDSFTGILSDYPDDPGATASYHLDALALAAAAGIIGGGESDATTARTLDAQKVYCLFPVTTDDFYYAVLIRKTVADPTAVDDLEEDGDGPAVAEAPFVPKAVLGREANNRQALGTNRANLVTDATQWTLLYHLWRRKPCYLKFPGIAPVIPNGYAQVIRWSFSSTDLSTTYSAQSRSAGTANALAGSECPVRFLKVTGAYDEAAQRYPAVVLRQEGLPAQWLEEDDDVWLVGANDEDLVVGHLYLARAGNVFGGKVTWATFCCGSGGPTREDPPTVSVPCCVGTEVGSRLLLTFVVPDVPCVHGTSVVLERTTQSFDPSFPADCWLWPPASTGGSPGGDAFPTCPPSPGDCTPVRCTNYLFLLACDPDTTPKLWKLKIYWLGNCVFNGGVAGVGSATMTASSADPAAASCDPFALTFTNAAYTYGGSSCNSPGAAGTTVPAAAVVTE